MRNSTDIVVENLNTLKQKMGFSEAKIAQLATLHQPAVNDYLKGKKKPSLPVLDKFAKAFGVSVAEILTDPKQSQITPRIVEPTPREALTILSKMFDKYGEIIEALEKSPSTCDLVRESLALNHSDAGDSAQRKTKA